MRCDPVPRFVITPADVAALREALQPPAPPAPAPKPPTRAETLADAARLAAMTDEEFRDHARAAWETVEHPDPAPAAVPESASGDLSGDLRGKRESLDLVIAARRHTSPFWRTRG